MIVKTTSTNRFITTSLCCMVFICLNACSKTEKKEDNTDKVIKQSASNQNEVDVMILKKGSFREELLSNGKLVAVKKSVLKFEVDGTLEQILVKEGQYVSKNTILAKLNPYKYQQALEDSEIALKKALLEFEDMLIGRDYDIKKKEEIPEKIYQMVSLRSGYTEALQKVKKAKYDLDGVSLTAPFYGKVATIKYKVHEQVSSGSVFLTLINDNFFEVEFYITESEIHKIKVNEPVTILAIGSQKEYQGKVTVINPVVEKNGTILIKAMVKNDQNLLEGMNVKISVEKMIPNQFIIPKSAILLRQDQKVLFKAIKGKAYWTYIHTTNENKDYYTVIPDREKSASLLKVGDTIITNGNLTLAHDSKIMIKNLITNKNPLGFKN